MKWSPQPTWEWFRVQKLPKQHKRLCLQQEKFFVNICSGDPIEYPVQYLKETDYELRKEFAKTMKEKLSDSQFLSSILWTDEANFTLDGCVYSSMCNLGTCKPPCNYWKAIKKQAVTCLGCIFINFFIGPFFFNSTVTSQSYLSMLEEYVILVLKRTDQHIWN